MSTREQDPDSTTKVPPGHVVIHGEQPDWTISDLYHRSWDIVKRHKTLWVFGMAIAGMGGMSFQGNSRVWDNFGERLIDRIPSESQQAPDAASQVLGAVTASPWGELISSLFSQVPLSFYVILAVELVGLVLVGIVVSLVSNSWANASLIQSIQTALGNHQVSIRSASEKAFKSITQLIWLSVIPSLIFWVVSLSVFAVLLVGLFFGPTPLKVVSGLLLFVAVLLWLFLFIMLVLTEVWALRKVILNEKPWREAFWQGLRMAKRKFWPMLLLGLVNTVLSFIIIGGPILVLVGLLLGGFLSFEGNRGLAIGLFVGGGLLGLALVLGYLLLVGIITAFKASTWTIAYNQIQGKYE